MNVMNISKYLAQENRLIQALISNRIHFITCNAISQVFWCFHNFHILVYECNEYFRRFGTIFFGNKLTFFWMIYNKSAVSVLYTAF